MRRKSAETALDPREITRRALDLIDRDGLAKFSIRRLAAAMDVFPTAILWHVDSRDRLLARVVAQVLADLPLEQGGRIWQDRLADIAYAYRRAVHKHPNIAPLLGADLTSNAGVSMDFIEAILSALHEAGLEGEPLIQGYNAFTGAFIGFVSLELAPEPRQGNSDLRLELQDKLAHLDSARHPHLYGLAGSVSDRAFVTRWTSGAKAPLDDGFDRLINALINDFTLS